LSFELAAQLKRLGCLGKLYTCTPKFTKYVPIEKYGLVREDIKSLAVAEVLPRITSRLWRSCRVEADWFKTMWFHRWVSRNMEPCDVVHAWTGSALSIFKSSQSLLPLRILDRSILHRKVALDLLEYEYSRYDIIYKDDPRGLNLELDEYELSDGIIVPSKFVLKSFLKSGYPQKKIFIVPFGCPVIETGLPRKPERKFRVLYVGALTVRKGIRYFLEAIPKFAGLIDFEVVIVGPPPEKPVVPYLNKCLAKYESIVNFIGYRSKRDLYEKIYPTASVLVQPSIMEGISYVLLEALAHGVPVIATENTGALDIISDGEEGFIVPIRDPKAIASRILALYHNRDLLEEMSKKACRKGKEAVTWDNYGDRILAVYKHLLGIIKQSHE
jgi:glycosyltransferase involved in cell wall biosynthesis